MRISDWSSDVCSSDLASGRNTFQIYTEAMDALARDRALMAGALRKALDRGEFRLLFQPKLDLATGHISGVEALLLCHCTDLGVIPPEIGRASCRVRVCQYVYISLVAVSLKKKK